MVYQVLVRLGTSPHIKDGQGNPLWGIGSPNQDNHQRKSWFPLLGAPEDDQAIQL